MDCTKTSQDNIHVILKENASKLYSELEGLKLSKHGCRQMKEIISKYLCNGLRFNHQKNELSQVKMIYTYLGVVPNGTEKGRYFAIDLGGTRLRFVDVEILNMTVKSKLFYFDVPKKAMSGGSDNLFDFIAKSIKDCLEKVGMLATEIEYFGFSFSFPCHGSSTKNGTLVTLNKGYTTREIEGKNVVDLLKRSCNKLKLNIKQFILINDTVGTFMYGVFKDSRTVVGVVNGTGTNLCYIEKTENVHNLTQEYNLDEIIINTELGAAGDTSKEFYNLCTSIDRKIDEESNNPGQQVLEKLVSGMYMGEIARQYIISASRNAEIFQQNIPALLLESYTLSTEMISLSYSQDHFITKFQDLFQYKLDLIEYAVIHNICKKVSKRSAAILAIGLLTFIEKIDRKECVIAADGSLFIKHPNYLAYVNKYVKKNLKHGKKISNNPH